MRYIPQMQRRALQNQLAPARESLDELQLVFVQNVNHELRTPLTIVLGYAELLRDESLGPLTPDQRQAAFAIVNQTYEMQTLVNRIGVLLAVEAHTGVLVPVAPAELAAAAVEKQRARAARAGLTLQVCQEPGLPFVSGDPDQLCQALDCLIENALKFTPAGGQVHVRIHAEPNWVCWTVTDSGIGIPEDELECLFRGFYQVDGSTTRSYRGVGMGLTLVRVVVGAHGGQIEVESAPGRGSRFTVRLPASTGAPTLALPGEARPRADVQRTWRILVVDDEDKVASALQSALTKMLHCQVVMATSGQEALQLFEQQPFDLLITDYKMPGMDGISLALRVRQLYPQAAIVMITAYGNDDLHQEATRASIRFILDKPVRLSTVGQAALEAMVQSESAQPIGEQP